MACAFGFEKDHYDVSLKTASLGRRAQRHKSLLITADGFSCREQIRQTTEREALHLAQVIQIAMREALSPGMAFDIQN